MTMNKAIVYMTAVTHTVNAKATTITEFILSDKFIRYAGPHELRTAKATVEVTGRTCVMARMRDMAASGKAINMLGVIPGRGKISY